MRYSSTLVAALAVPLLATARPIRRAASANDALVFQFANVLEQLETEFYAQGIKKFQDSDFQAAGFSSSVLVSQALSTIQGDEAIHTTVIQQALKDNGADPLICKFKFGDALKDVPTMAATARAVELVGVAAYLGGATIIDDPVLLDAAASILTVEARHQTVLNIMSGSGSSIPAAFDIALTPPEVLSIAGGFIDGDCNTGITPANTLTITNTNPQVGDLLQFQATNITGTDGLFCNMMLGGMPFALSLPLDQCNIPPGVNGPVMVWVTNDPTPLINNVVDRDTITQVAGPAIIFVDTQPEMLGQMVRGSGSNSGATSTETTTISPEEAGKIISSAATSTPAAGGDGQAGGNGAAAPASTPLPKDFTGPSPDGKTTVIGLKQVPKPAADPNASSGAPASASSTDSAAAPSSSA
ncbi:ferritin-like domain-containing protein [Favolaschia claudopus]|uniref:Ferritin-like domain-containing protein n=1 Tax=Favolaschia claudopus TaxID=2862362 RepID=A0AAW0E9R7_9AGAR